jgi:hypothetical protein
MVDYKIHTVVKLERRTRQTGFNSIDVDNQSITLSSKM